MAMIFDIQHFSIHNGPGIRTTLFFKGCPLRCTWCHNPESLSRGKDRIFRNERCIHCNDCLRICPKLKAGALPLNDSCDACEACMAVCPTNALEVYGKDITTVELVQEILKDKVFFETSMGGVTLSGGEPLFQEEALKALLKALKAEGIHIALDTSGFSKWQIFEEIKASVDLFLYDLKHLDEEKHRHGTGVAVASILDNYIRLQSCGQRIWARIPMIPDYNMDQEHIDKLTDFLILYPPEQVNLLPYHGVASRKYELLGIPMAGHKKSETYEAQLKEIQQNLTDAGLKCLIGG